MSNPAAPDPEDRLRAEANRLAQVARDFDLLEIVEREIHAALEAVVAQEREAIITRLHETCGVCGHCSKRTCPEKRNHSMLPGRLSGALVLEAIRARGLKE